LGLCAQANNPPIPVLYIPANAESAEFADPSHGAVLIKPLSAPDLVMVSSSLVRQYRRHPHTRITFSSRNHDLCRFATHKRTINLEW
jgi:hypothetical protein